MDTDNARHASEEIYRRIRHQVGLNRSNSTADVTLQPEPRGLITQEGLILRRGASGQMQIEQSDTMGQTVREAEGGTEAAGGSILAEHTSLFHGRGARGTKANLFCPPISDTELDLECH